MCIFTNQKLFANRARNDGLIMDRFNSLTHKHSHFLCVYDCPVEWCLLKRHSLDHLLYILLMLCVNNHIGGLGIEISYTYFSTSWPPITFMVRRCRIIHTTRICEQTGFAYGPRSRIVDVHDSLSHNITQHYTSYRE